MLNLPSYYNNQIFKQSWKYHKSIKSCVFSTSLHQYVVRVATFSQCLSLIKLNAQENKWIVAIKILIKEKIARKNNYNDSICSQYTNAYNLSANWDGKEFFLNTTQVDHKKKIAIFFPFSM